MAAFYDKQFKNLSYTSQRIDDCNQVIADISVNSYNSEWQSFDRRCRVPEKEKKSEFNECDLGFPAEWKRFAGALKEKKVFSQVWIFRGLTPQKQKWNDGRLYRENRREL